MPVATRDLTSDQPRFSTQSRATPVQWETFQRPAKMRPFVTISSVADLGTLNQINPVSCLMGGHPSPDCQSPWYGREMITSAGASRRGKSFFSEVTTAREPLKESLRMDPLLDWTLTFRMKQGNKVMVQIVSFSAQ